MTADIRAVEIKGEAGLSSAADHAVAALAGLSGVTQVVGQRFVMHASLSQKPTLNRARRRALRKRERQNRKVRR